MDAKNRRTRFVIKKGLQFRYMGVILFTMLFMALIAGWTIYSTIWNHLTEANLGPASMKISAILDQINHELLFRLPVLAFLLAVSSLFISHRIAGPIYRFEMSAKTIANGDLTLRVKLRKGDELQHLSECFNQMAENLENLVISDREAISRIIKVIKDLPVGLRSEELPELKKKEMVDQLVRVVDELKAITRSFKVTGESEEEEEEIT